MGSRTGYLKSVLSIAQQRGFVSLLTSIVVGLILIVITVSGITLMIGELRQANDFDQSTKAYFAAESGLEDAVAEVRQALASGVPLDFGNPDDCDIDAGNPNLSGDNAVAYTCQLITTVQNQIEGSLSVEESTVLDFSGLDFSLLELQWNQRGSTDPQWNTGSIPFLFPPGPVWSGRFPAVMEVTITSYPESGTFAAADITSNTLVLKPSSAGGSSSVSSNTAAATGPTSVPCRRTSAPGFTDGQYACSIDITNFVSNRNYIIRLHARYSRANYAVEIRTAAGVVDIPDSQLTIDVTARAGDIFRRVQARLPIDPQDVQPSPLNYALLGDEAICKVMEVSDVRNQANAEDGCL